MKPLTSANVESELSYAYLHAVASAAHVGCSYGTRHEDNTGVDAKLVGWGPFPNGGWREEVDLKIQLKATIKQPTVVDGCLSYYFSGVPQYDDLRKETVATPRILVVLFLPPERAKWIEHTKDALTLRNCAYWVSLRGAGESDNKTGQTVYIPQDQHFDPEGVVKLMSMLSRNEIPQYKGLNNV